ncbi:MAG: LEPR-XLL domain-containing protein [Nitrospiraceae bacterium]|nr:LEPR-XLL domain-containing protein [Nitrospiraceae bacterium]
MKFTKLLNFTIRHHRESRPNAFVLESLEPRVLLSATPMIAAVVTTDHLDYAPGETAVITTANQTGEGPQFAAGEMVRFQVARTDDMADSSSTTANVGPAGNGAWYVIDGIGGFTTHQQFDAMGQAIDRDGNGIADWIAPDNDNTVNGSISTTWFVEEQYRNSSLIVTAADQKSGAIANQAFTDAAINTTTTVTSSSATSTYGNGVTFTATVTAAIGTTAPTGMVEFFDGETSLGPVSIPANTGTGISTWTIATASLTGGTHLIHAIFTGNVLGGNSYNNSTSLNITQTVNKATVTITGAGLNGTGFFVTYDGAAHVATGTVKGIGGVVIGQATSSTPHTNATPGLYGDTLTYAGDANYKAASKVVQSYILKATPTIIGNGLNGSGYFGTYDGTAHVATGTVRGVGGVVVGQATSSTPHTNAGLYSDTLIFVDRTGNYNDASKVVKSYILKATPTITGDGPNGSGYFGIYAGAAQVAMGTARGVGEVFLGHVISTTPRTNAGVYNDTLTYVDGTGNYNSASKVVKSYILKATVTITGDGLNGTGYFGTYDGQAHAATATVRSLGGVVVGQVTSSTPHTNTGLYSDTLTYAGDANYKAASKVVQSYILKATPTIIGNGLNGSGYYAPYDGQAYAAMATVWGAAGESLGQFVSSTTYTNAGVYSDTVTYVDGTGNYLNASKVVKSYILKATPTITGNGLNGSGYFGTYDGWYHAATATVTGVDGENLGTVTSATTHFKAGTYNDTVTFLGNANYKETNTLMKSYILQATAMITVSTYNVVFDGRNHVATGTAIGVNGEDLSWHLNLDATAHGTAGSYTDTYTFAGDPNYKEVRNKLVTNTILKATVTIMGDGLNGAGYYGIYDGRSHQAMATVWGTAGESLGHVESTTTHTNAGEYIDTFSFSGDANYKEASQVVNSYILKATAVITVTGYIVLYDGKAHTATGTAIGVNGEDVSGRLNFDATTHINVGNYLNDPVTFMDDNYETAIKFVSSVIIPF